MVRVKMSAARVVTAVLLVATGTACTDVEDRPPAEPKATAFSGFLVGAPIRLLTGQLDRDDSTPFDPRTLRGRVSIIFPGYTECPDQCPLTLATIAQAIHRLPPADRNRVDVYLLTLDPRHDTADRLQAYLDQFDPRFVGLTGEPQQLQQVYRALGVVDPLSTPDAAVNHVVAAFAFGPDGQARLAFDTSSTPQGVAADLRLLLSGRQPPQPDDTSLRATGGVGRAGYTSLISAFLVSSPSRPDTAELRFQAVNNDRTDDQITGVSINGIPADLLRNGQPTEMLELPAQAMTKVGRELRIRFAGLPSALLAQPAVDVSVTFASGGLALVRVPVSSGAPAP
jgi:protein SCO1/2